MSALWGAATGAHALELLAWVFVRGSILVAAAWAAGSLAGRRRAAVRHAAWAGALAALVVLPGLSRLLPDVGPRAEIVPAQAWETRAVPTAAPGVAPDARGARSPIAPAPFVLDPGAVHRDAGTPRASAGPASVAAGSDAVRRRLESGPDGAATGRAESSTDGAATWVALVLGVWLAGALLLVGRLAGRQVALRVVGGRARRWSDDVAWRELRRLSRRMGIRRRVRLLEVDDLPTPACWGMLRPAIGLPAEAASWSQARLRATLLHELSHVRRRDYAAYLCGELACALYWPNPAVWWAARRARSEAEAACDEAVLAHGTERVDYATLLLEAAREARRPALAPGPVMSMSPARDLGARIRGVLGFVAPRPVSRAARAGAAVLGLAVTLAVALPGLDSDCARRLGAVLAAADAPSGAVRAEAARALGRLGCREAVPTLAGLLGDDEPRVRADAATAIAEADLALAVVPLMRRLDDPDEGVREAVILALGRTRDRRPFYELEALTTAADTRIRLAATWAIGEIKCDPAILRLSTLAERSADAETRLVAVRGLRGAPAEAAAPALRRALLDPDVRVRAAAAESARLLS